MNRRSPYYLFARPVLAALAVAAGASLAVPVGAPPVLVAMEPAAACSAPVLAGSGEGTVAAASSQGEPGCECLDKHGEPRMCTHTEEYRCCRAAAQDLFEQCREAGGSYLGCDFERGINMMACNIKFFWPF